MTIFSYYITATNRSSLEYSLTPHAAINQTVPWGDNNYTCCECIKKAYSVGMTHRMGVKFRAIQYPVLFRKFWGYCSKFRGERLWHLSCMRIQSLLIFVFCSHPRKSKIKNTSKFFTRTVVLQTLCPCMVNLDIRGHKMYI